MGDLRVGVVGTGWVATDRYLPVLSRAPEVSIVGIADRNVARGNEVARRYGTTAYQEGSELLEATPDVVFICTSPFSHAELALSAMRHAAHVFVEKPMALDVLQAETMVATSMETGMRLGVSHNLLFSRSVRGARGRIHSGRLGQVRHVLAFQASSPSRRLPHWYPDLPGGLFFDEAPHMIYLLDSLIGPLSVDHGWSTRRGEGSVAALGATFSGDGGLIAELTMVFEAPISEWFVTVVCERGVVVIDLFRDIAFVIPPDGAHKAQHILRTSVSGILGHTSGTINTGVRYLARRQFWGHDLIIYDFLNSVRNRKSPAVTGEDGARVVTTMFEVLEAADSSGVG